MSHSITVPDNVYQYLKEEAGRENRSMSRQLAQWHKLARAAFIAKANNGTIEDTLELLESLESKGGEIIDVDSYFKSLS